MIRTLTFRYPAVLLALSIGVSALLGQTQPMPFKAPDGIHHRTQTIMSEGTRLAAELFSLTQHDGKKLPTIIMCHGWGGTAAGLRPDAVVFARAGYLVVTFDYRGWGASESRVILANPAPAERKGTRFTAEVVEVREVVDPLEQTTDLLNAIHWVQAEPQCATDRIGLWGSSYSGGHVVYAAARDPRVKATVSQVPALDSRFVIQPAAARAKTLDEATQRSRGVIGYPEPGVKAVGQLRGAPIREKLMHYAPVDDADKAPGCAMLFILAEKEELFKNEDHGIKAHARARGPKKLVTIPNITHYGVYREARAQAQELALGWFEEHLKKADPPTPVK
jgi:dienelactone hydrolase